MPDLRELIDPNHTLPPVELRTERKQEWVGSGLVREDERIYLDGEAVGECTIVTQTSPDDSKVHFDGIEVYDDNNQNNRGRGIGLVTYLLAIERAHERNLPFETQDATQTGNAKRIWELLAQRGVAQVIEPFHPIPRREDRFEGKYRVPVEPKKPL